MFSGPHARFNYAGLGLILAGLLLIAIPGEAGILDAAWTAPTTNTDGSPLTDLSAYRVYYGTSGTPCPGGTFLQTASTTPNPGPGQTVSVRVTGLSTTLSYNIAVTAVDTSGSESTCSTAASAVARIAFAASPTGTVSFGSVNVGSFKDQVFTVSNTGGGTVSGTVSTSAPFSIVSGSPFSLVGVGATQAVTVRFTPTTSATASANVSFAADGDIISRIASGTGVAQTFALTVSKAGTGSGTVTSAPAGISCGVTCTGSYASATAVTLTATPAAGSTFSGWSGACTGPAAACSVTMSVATTVTATFAPQISETFTLTP